MLYLKELVETLTRLINNSGMPCYSSFTEETCIVEARSVKIGVMLATIRLYSVSEDTPRIDGLLKVGNKIVL